MAVLLSLFAGAGQQFFTNAGVPLAGGKIFTYGAGGSTPQATYTTSAGNIAHSNPIVLDAAGRVPSGGEIWLTSNLAYKFVLQTSANVTVQTLDNVGGGVDGATLAASSGSSLIGFIQAGSGAVARTVQSKLRDMISVKDFGAVGDGIADDYAAILAASTAAAASGKQVYFPAGTYLVKSPFSFSSLADLKWQGTGVYSSIIKKGFNGDLITLNNCVAFESRNMHYQGQYGTYTGKCFVVKGTSTYPVWINNMTEGFSGLHIEFQSNAGFSANIIGHQGTILAGQPASNIIGLTSADTGYTARKIDNSLFSGFVDVSGCNDFYISGSQFGNLITDANTFNCFVDGCRFGTGGATTTLYGTTKVSNCSFAGSVVLDASFVGTFIGNQQSGGTPPYFTGSASAIQVVHKAPTDPFMYINRNKMSVAITPSEMQLNQIISIGDVNYTWNPDSTATILSFGTNLTTNRTLTLTTTDARSGMVVRVARSAGNTGGPWNLVIGATGKNLTIGTWCDVTYNGSYWEVTAAGSL